MKSITVQGKIINGKNYGDLRRQILAMNLKTDELTNAILAAKEAFPKQEHHRRSGRGYPGQKVQDKATVISRKEMDFDGLKLEVLKGPMHKVLQKVQGRGRNVVFAAVETHFTSRTAIVILLQGAFDQIAYGKIDKTALAPYFKLDGYSMLSSIKAVGDRRTGVVFQATGENMQVPNVRDFVQAFARIAYDGNILVGASIDGKEISTNVFLTPDELNRQAATWPAKSYGAYALVDIGALPVSYLGERGYVGVNSSGKVLVALFASILAAGLQRLFNTASAVAKMPWAQLGQIDLASIGGKILDVAIAQTADDDTYKVFVTGEGKIAILTIAWKNDAFKLEGTIEYKDFKYDGMALLGRANKDTVIITNRNGGPTAIAFVPMSELSSQLPMFGATPTATQAQA